jgi:hypothetical protein
MVFEALHFAWEFKQRDRLALEGPRTPVDVASSTT